jgi:hypothetical protein
MIVRMRIRMMIAMVIMISALGSDVGISILSFFLSIISTCLPFLS